MAVQPVRALSGAARHQRRRELLRAGRQPGLLLRPRAIPQRQCSRRSLLLRQSKHDRESRRLSARQCLRVRSAFREAIPGRSRHHHAVDRYFQPLQQRRGAPARQRGRAIHDREQLQRLLLQTEFALQPDHRDSEPARRASGNSRLLLSSAPRPAPLPGRAFPPSITDTLPLRMTRLTRIFIVIFLATLSGCSRTGASYKAASVILISIDTLRSDHLPVYGYGGVATPNLDLLAADSVVFNRAYSHVPLTLPSHATLFTGLLPAQNGVHDNVAFSLAPSHETMASLFGSHGYATGGAVSAIVLSHESGISRGFEFYDDAVEPTRVRESLGRVQRSGAETENKLIEWIDGEKRRPLFAFLHLYEPHSPYEPPEPFAGQYREHPYDGEIAAADAIVGTFLKDLKSRGLYDSSIVVLLSDHGEGLGEHGEA